MKHKELPISPANWNALKRNVPGLAKAAQDAQRVSAKTTPFSTIDIRIINKETKDKDSARILRKNGLRPLTLKEVLFAVTQDSELRQKLMGKWIWIKDNGTNTKGFYTIQPDFSLKPGKSKDPERNVFCWPGNKPSRFKILDDNEIRRGGRRFWFSAEDDPAFTDLVIGLPKSVRRQT